MLRDRMRGHMDEIGDMPGVREFERRAAIADADADIAREGEVARIYEETLRGHEDASYILELMSGDTEEGGIYWKFAEAVMVFQEEINCLPCPPDELEQRLNAEDFERFGRKIFEVMKAAAEKYAERAVE